MSILQWSALDFAHDNKDITFLDALGKKYGEFQRSTSGIVKEFNSFKTAFSGATTAGKGFVSALSAGLSALNPVTLGLAALATTVAIIAPLVNAATDSVDEIIARGKEAQQTISDVYNEYDTKKTTVDKADRFEELSAGVDVTTNENISLTNEEYTEYISLCNEIAGIYPSLVSSYDAQGNAILNLGTSAQTASEQLKQMLDVDQQIANFKIADNLQDAFEGVQTQVELIETQMDQLKTATEQTEALAQDTQFGSQISTSISQQLDAIKNGAQSITLSNDVYAQLGEKFKKTLGNHGIATVTQRGDKNTVLQLLGGFSYDSLNDAINDIQGDISTAQYDIWQKASQGAQEGIFRMSSKQKEIDGLWNGLLSSYKASLETNPNFSQLGTDIQEGILNQVGQIDYSKMSKDQLDDIEGYIKDTYLYPISEIFNDSNAKQTQNAIEKLFSPDLSNLKPDDYRSKIDSCLSEVQSYYTNKYGTKTGNELYSDFAVNLGFKIKLPDGSLVDADEVRRNNIKERLGQDNLDDNLAKLDTLTAEQVIEIDTKLKENPSANAETLINDYADQTKKAVGKTNKLSLSDLFLDAEGKQTEWSKSIDTFQSELSSIQETITSINNGEKLDLTDLTQQFPTLANQTGDLSTALQDLATKTTSDSVSKILQGALAGDFNDYDAVGQYISKMLSGVDLSGVDLSQVQSSLTTALAGVFESKSIEVPRGFIENVVAGWMGNIDQSTVQLEKYQTEVDNVISKQSQVASALESSKSATGLSTEEIKNLTDAYKDLDSFDAGKLFEQTANGVRVNKKALEELQTEINNNTESELLEKIRQKNQELLEVQRQGGDTSAIENQIAMYSNMVSQLDAATSAYQRFLTAQSGSNERDSMENVGKQYDSMEKILQGGWLGDESLNAYVDLLVAAEKQTGNMYDDFAQISKTIDGTNHSLKDYFTFDDSGEFTEQGIDRFINDLHDTMGDSYASWDGSAWHIDLTGEKLQEVATRFGTTTDAVKLFIQAMKDANFDIDWTDDTDIAAYGNAVDKARQKVQELKKEGKIKTDIELDFDSSSMSTDELKSKIEELQTIEIDPKVDKDGSAEKALNDLIAKTQQQYYFQLNLQTDGGLDEAVQKVQEIQQIIAEAQTENPVISVKAVVEGSEEIQTIAQEISELPPEVQTEIGISTENVGDAQSILKQLGEKPESVNVPVNYTIGTDEASEYEPKDKEFTTKAKLDSKAVDSYKPQDKKFNVTAVPITSAVDSLKFPPKYLDVYTVPHEGTNQGPKATGTATLALGTAHALGSGYQLWSDYRHGVGAYAGGTSADWALKHNETALVNEESVNGHSESIVRDGVWSLIPGGSHFANLKKGDIIFSAKQTEELMKYGKINGHARTVGMQAHANGTAYNMPMLHAYASRYGASGSGQTASWGDSRANAGQGQNDVANTTKYRSGISKAAQQAANNIKNGTKKVVDKTKETASKVKNTLDAISKWTSGFFDWQKRRIENLEKDADTAISRVDLYTTRGLSSRGNEKAVKGFYNTAISSTNKAIGERQNYADVTLTKQVDKVYKKYMKAAAPVYDKGTNDDGSKKIKTAGLTNQDKKDIKKAYEVLKKGGTLKGISEYSEEAQKAISALADYFDQIRDQKDAIISSKKNLEEWKEALVRLPLDVAEDAVEKLSKKLEYFNKKIDSYTSRGLVTSKGKISANYSKAEKAGYRAIDVANTQKSYYEQAIKNYQKDFETAYKKTQKKSSGLSDSQQRQVSKYYSYLRNDVDFDVESIKNKDVREAVKELVSLKNAEYEAKTNLIDLNDTTYKWHETIANLPIEAAAQAIEKLNGAFNGLDNVLRRLTTTQKGGATQRKLNQLMKDSKVNIKDMLNQEAKSNYQDAKTKTKEATADKKDAQKTVDKASKTYKATEKNIQKRFATAQTTLLSDSGLTSAQKKTVTSGKKLDLSKVGNSNIDKELKTATTAVNKISGLSAAQKKAIKGGKTIDTKGLKGKNLTTAKAYNKAVKAKQNNDKLIKDAKAYNKLYDQTNYDASQMAALRVSDRKTALEKAEKTRDAQQKTLLNDKGLTAEQKKTVKAGKKLSTNGIKDNALKSRIDKYNKSLEEYARIKKLYNEAVQSQNTLESAKDELAAANLREKAAKSNQASAKATVGAVKSVAEAMDKDFNQAMEDYDPDDQIAWMNAFVDQSTEEKRKAVTIAENAKAQSAAKLEEMRKKYDAGEITADTLRLYSDADDKEGKNLTEAWSDYAEQYTDAVHQKVQNIASYYDQLISLQQASNDAEEQGIKLAQAHGEYAKSEDFTKQIDDLEQRKTLNREAANKIYEEIDNAVKEGRFKPGDLEWMQNTEQAKKYENEGRNIEVQQEELRQQAIKNDIEQMWGRAIEKANQYISKLETIQGMINDQMTIDNDGHITEVGALSLALTEEQMRQERQTLTKQLQERAYLIQKYKNGDIGEKEYEEQMKTLNSNINSTLSNLSSYTNKELNLLKSVTEAERDALLDSINTYKTALQKKKEYWNYDKNIKAKSKEIQALEQQSRALQNAMSLEDKARKARIDEQLETQRQDLEDTIKEHVIDLQVQGLDDLSDFIQKDYKKYLQDMMGNIDKISEYLANFTQNHPLTEGEFEGIVNRLFKSQGIKTSASQLGVMSAGYASGTMNASPGWHKIGEEGPEILITKDGTMLYPFQGGEKVFTNGITENLLSMAQSLNASSIAKIQPIDVSSALKNNGNINFNYYGNMIDVHGNLTKDLLPNMQTLTKQLSATIQKDILRDLKKIGY